MTGEMFFVLAVVLVTVLLFAWEKLPVDLVSIMVMSALILSGVVSPGEGISGFSHPATVTVTAMFVLSGGLYRSGAVNFVGEALLRIGRRNFWLALLALMLTAGTMSAFINDTAVVAIFLPIVMGLSRDLKISPSKLLMPLSFGALFGGVCTLIGTSTNILVSAIAVKSGAPAFGMFEFSKFGVIILVTGILYMFFIGVRLIPERGGENGMALEDVRREYQVEVTVDPDAECIGETLARSELAKLEIDIQELIRDGIRVRLPVQDVPLKANDLLRVRCDVDQVRKLLEMAGFSLRSKAHWHETVEEEGTLLVEAVIGPNSRLEGKTLKDARFRTLVGGTVHGIRHRGRLMLSRLEDTVLYPGDVLLIEMPTKLLELLHGYQAFVVISEAVSQDFRRKKIPVAIAIIASVVVSAAIGLVPILVGAVVGAVLMVLTGCLTLEEAYEVIQWKIVFLLGGVLALGLAMERTGTALYLANQLVATVGVWGPIALVSAFYLMTSVMTEIMSNNATAALLTPIAIATAAALNIDSRPFLMAVTYAASAAFMTPVGYQSNTLIYGPGRYKYVDFLKVGTPLNLLFWLLATFLIPVFWPFHP